MEQPQPYKLLVLPYKDGYRSIRPDQILYIEANRNYCKVVSNLGITFTLRKTLKEIEYSITQIQPSGIRLIRVHTSYILALANIQFDKAFTEAIVSNGDSIPISRAYRKNLDENLDML